MSVFNDHVFVKSAIESVRLQTFKDWEMIIVDDASTDETPNVIKNIKKEDKRIKSYRIRINKGAPMCLNKGIALSSGEFIARIDSDDIWTNKYKLEKQLQAIRNNPKLVFIGTWAKVIGINNNEIFCLNYPTDYLTIKDQMLKHNCFISSSILIQRNFFEKTRGYGTSGRYAEDYGLWMQLGRMGEFANIPKYMTGYRINPKGISQTKYKGQINATLRLIKENRRFYPHYLQAFLLWNLRKYYPKWLKGAFSENIRSIT